MNQLSQKDRVLRLLRQRGNRGITAVDFLGPYVADGGKPITRVAARVQDLRDAGYDVQTVGKRNQCAVYVLMDPPPRPVREREQTVESLFDPGTATARPASPYDIAA